jgi:hypothetical protein
MISFAKMSNASSSFDGPLENKLPLKWREQNLGLMEERLNSIIYSSVIAIR